MCYPNCVSEQLEIDINDPDIQEAAARHLKLDKPFQKIRFATMGTGLDLSRLAWLSQSHVFSCQQQELQSSTFHFSTFSCYVFLVKRT